MGYLKKRRFGTLYKGLFPQPIQGASLHPSNQVIRYRKFFRRESHAMLLVSPNRFLVSVNQDSPSREGRESLYFRCRVPLFPVRESPSALSGRARILMSEDKRYPLSKGVIRAVGGPLESCGSLPLHEWGQSVKRFRFSVGSRSPAPHSPLVGRVVNLEGARLLFRRVLDNLPGLTFSYKLAGQRWIEGKIDLSSSGTGPSIDHRAYSTLTEFILLKRKKLLSHVAFRCSPLPEAKDGVEPSFQDLQSDTFPLCYLAKPATSCAKVKRLLEISLSPLLPVSILIDSLLPSRGFGRPIWLVQLSLLEAPAVVRLRTPRPRRLRADRCLPGEIGALEFSPSTLFDRGGEYHSINNKNKVAIPFKNGLSLEATYYLSIGENRLLLAASPICSIMAGLETSEEDHHLYPDSSSRTYRPVLARFHKGNRRFTRESRIVPFDRDVNARDLLGIVMDFMADI
ncbi:hypothetical protein FEM48_ZijujMtG0001500 (mitochondrion) [Ziziphus jujuba var. spinosa]|uniref:Uncharacterized protein n=1 Tax=Ziziphus jujuba var. spinosa TaxID=714518 RepID=A0A978UA66_ZIZJJ|nr:hypothetical protein FEM48_ZijujMtG0001500 [Ziziphus jujuba var. spinosa]